MASAPSTLIIPVESQVRELDAKLLLACVAAEREIPVVIGSRPFVNFAMPYLPRGVLLAKSMRVNNELMHRLVRGLGHDIVAWDEESLVRFSSPEYYPWRYSEKIFRTVNRLFAWGPDDAEMFSRYPGYRGVPIHVTGNPRIDLLRKELRAVFDAEAEALRNRFGDFILVNTNFSFVNGFVPAINLLLPSGNGGRPVIGRTGQGMSFEFATGMAAHQQAIFDHFRALLPLLSEWFPGRAIVIRPHPSESQASWQAVASGRSNVHVIHEGNVVPWLLACRVLLHNGCTTAVEASVLGVPALAYQPVTADCFDYHLPNALSHRASTPDDVREIVSSIVGGTTGPSDGVERRRLLARHLASTDGPLAADRIVDALVEAGYGSYTPPRPAVATYLKAWVRTNARTVVKRFRRAMPNDRAGAAYHDQRFPEIGADQLNRRIQQFSRLLGRFENVRVQRMSRYLFSVGAPVANAIRVASAPWAAVKSSLR